MNAGSQRHQIPDVVVIGGGLVGICTALYLQRTGRRVMLLERQSPGIGASGHNGGVFGIASCVPVGTPGVVRSVPKMLRDPMSPLAIRWSYLPRMAPWLVRFVLASRQRRVEAISIALASLLDRAMEAYEPLLAESGGSSVVHNGGLLYGFRGEEAHDAATSSFALRARRGVQFDVLDAAELEAIHPALAGRFTSAVYVPDARFTTDPRELTRTFAARFVDQGGEIVQGEATGFDRRNGEVRAVVTPFERIDAGAVVIAAGAWSRRLAKLLNVDVPLDTERGYGIDLPAPGLDLPFPVIVNDDNVAISPFASGIRVTGVDELGGLAAPPDFTHADRALAQAKLTFPELRTAGGRPWMSYRPSMPDSLPVISQAPEATNAYLAFGHGHTGMCMAAITGRLVQELADRETPSVDLRPFSPTRFAGRRRTRSGWRSQL